MILNHYIKTGLATLAALLCVGGGNAYAESTVVYGRALTADADNNILAWSDNDVSTKSTAKDIWVGNMTYDPNYGLYGTGNGNRSGVLTFNHTANSIQTFDIVYNNLANVKFSGNYAYMKIGSDIEIMSDQMNQKGEVIVNGTSYEISNCNKKNINRGGDLWTIHIEINTATNTLNALTLSGNVGDAKAASFTLREPTALSATATYDKVEVGAHRAKYQVFVALQSIKIAEEEQAVTTVPYTINYTDGGTILKTVTGETAIGATVSADKSIDVDGTKYILESTEVPSITIKATDNTLNVPVRKPYTATLNVTKNINGTATTTTTSLTETDDHVATWSYAFPLYAKGSDGVYYKTDATTFGETGTFTDGETINKTVDYTTADNDIVFYSEGEAAAVNSANNYSYSNGADGHVAYQNGRDRGISVGSLDAGRYSFDVVFTDVHKRSLGLRHATDDPLIIVQPTKTGESSTEFTLDATTADLYINGANYSDKKTLQSEDFDYVVIRRVNNVSAEINTESNLTTFCSTSTVTVPEDVMVYIATSADNNTVQLERVDTKVIPAGTGVILYSAEAGTKALTVGGTADASLYANNIFKAATSDVTAGDNTYALVKGKQGFAKVKAGVIIPAGKAYLETTAGSKLAINFGGETTGISKVATELTAPENSAMYNLAGQRVSNSYKGIVIKNGKKFINK